MSRLGSTFGTLGQVAQSAGGKLGSAIKAGKQAKDTIMGSKTFKSLQNIATSLNKTQASLLRQSKKSGALEFLRIENEKEFQKEQMEFWQILLQKLDNIEKKLDGLGLGSGNGEKKKGLLGKLWDFAMGLLGLANTIALIRPLLGNLLKSIQNLGRRIANLGRRAVGLPEKPLETKPGEKKPGEMKPGEEVKPTEKTPRQAVEEANKIATEVEQRLQAQKDSIDKLRETIKTTEDRLKSLRESIIENNKKVKQLIEERKLLVERNAPQIERDAISREIFEVKEEIKSTKQQIINLDQQLEKTNTELKETQKVYSETKQASVEIKENVKLLEQKAVEAERGFFEKLKEGFDKLFKDIKETAKATEAPKAAETPRPTEAPKPTETPRSTESPTTAPETTAEAKPIETTRVRGGTTSVDIKYEGGTQGKGYGDVMPDKQLIEAATKQGAVPPEARVIVESDLSKINLDAVANEANAKGGKTTVEGRSGIKYTIETQPIAADNGRPAVRKITIDASNVAFDIPKPQTSTATPTAEPAKTPTAATPEAPKVAETPTAATPEAPRTTGTAEAAPKAPAAPSTPMAETGGTAPTSEAPKVAETPTADKTTTTRGTLAPETSTGRVLPTVGEAGLRVAGGAAIGGALGGVASAAMTAGLGGDAEQIIQSGLEGGATGAAIGVGFEVAGMTLETGARAAAKTGAGVATDAIIKQTTSSIGRKIGVGAAGIGLEGAASSIVPIVGWAWLAYEAIKTAYSSGDMGREIAESQIMSEKWEQVGTAMQNSAQLAEQAERIKDTDPEQYARLVEMSNNNAIAGIKQLVSFDATVQAQNKLDKLVDMDKIFQVGPFGLWDRGSNYTLNDIMNITRFMEAVPGSSLQEKIKNAKENPKQYPVPGYNIPAPGQPLVSENLSIEETEKLITSAPSIVQEYNETLSNPMPRFKELAQQAKAASEKRQLSEAGLIKDSSGRVRENRMSPMNKFNTGGYVPGPDVDEDIVPAMLTPGEFVLRRDAVKSIGLDALYAMNEGVVPSPVGYSEGGLITPIPNTSTPVPVTPVDTKTPVPTAVSGQDRKKYEVTFDSFTKAIKIEIIPEKGLLYDAIQITDKIRALQEDISIKEKEKVTVGDNDVMVAMPSKEEILKMTDESMKSFVESSTKDAVYNYGSEEENKEAKAADAEIVKDALIEYRAVAKHLEKITSENKDVVDSMNKQTETIKETTEAKVAEQPKPQQGPSIHAEFYEREQKKVEKSLTKNEEIIENITNKLEEMETRPNTVTTRQRKKTLTQALEKKIKERQKLLDQMQEIEEILQQAEMQEVARNIANSLQVQTTEVAKSTKATNKTEEALKNTQAHVAEELKSNEQVIRTLQSNIEYLKSIDEVANRENITQLQDLLEQNISKREVLLETQRTVEDDLHDLRNDTTSVVQVGKIQQEEMSRQLDEQLSNTQPVATSTEATKISVEEEVKKYEENALKGDVDSMYNAGIAYMEGKGVTKNLETAKIYFQMASDKGDEQAKYMLDEVNKELSQPTAMTPDNLPEHLSVTNMARMFDEKETAVREYERSVKELESIKSTEGENSEEYVKQSRKVEDLKKTSEKKKEDYDYAVDMRRTLVGADEHIESARKTAETSKRTTAEFRRSVGLPEDSGPIEKDTRTVEEIMDSVYKIMRSTPTGFEAMMPPEAAILEEDKRVKPGTGWVTALADTSTSVEPITGMGTLYSMGQSMASAADSGLYAKQKEQPSVQKSFNNKIVTALLEATNRLNDTMENIPSNNQPIVVNNSNVVSGGGGGGGGSYPAYNGPRFTTAETAIVNQMQQEYGKGAVC